jgi:hypothetical protein
MPQIVTAAELRSTLGVSVALYSDAFLDSILDAAENAILPMLVTYSQAVYGFERANNVTEIYLNTANIFGKDQTVTISGVDASINGTHTILARYNDRFEINNVGADVPFRRVIPSGKVATGTFSYVGNPNVENAVLVVAVEIFQSRFSSGGSIEGLDLQVTPYRIGIGLMSRVKGLLGVFLDEGSMIG